MSWHYLRELEGESLEDICSGGEPLQPLKSKITHAEFYCNGKLMDSYLDSLSGTTSEPLMENLGQEKSMSSQVDFLVKTFQPQEKAQESKESDLECGEKWRGSFVKYDPDTSLWRTHQCSLLGDLEPFSETWPQWGLMRNGECWEQRTLEQTIRGTGFGLSPNGVDSFHTPNTTGLDGGSNSRKALKNRKEKLPTPTASDYRSQPTSASWKAKGAINYKLSNPEIQAMWPTPDANCGLRGTQENWTRIRKSGQPAQYSINQAVRDAEKIKWPTPQASDHRDRGNMSNPCVQRRVEIGKQISLSQSVHPTSGQLNPTWVEWLMGWPLGWTDLKPLGMDKSHFVPPPHGES